MSDAMPRPNADEVDEVWHATPEELAEVSRDRLAEEFSPWFARIKERFLAQWWDRLDELLKHDSNDIEIHSLD